MAMIVFGEEQLQYSPSDESMITVGWLQVCMQGKWTKWRYGTTVYSVLSEIRMSMQGEKEVVTVSELSVSVMECEVMEEEERERK